MASSEAYMLPRNTSESQRLDWQHRWSKAITHNQLLHSSIPIQNVRAVADVATGTGAWIRDLARSWSALGGSWADERSNSTEFVGFDISAEQFPRDHVPHVRFCVQDATKAFYEQYKGKFDVVNVRLVSYAIKVDELADLISNILEILRPGGFLQWQEYDAIDVWTKPETELSRRANAAIVAERISRGLFPAIVSPLVKAIQAPTVLVPKVELNPITWTNQLLRIMQLQTISTDNHPEAFVRENTSAMIRTAAAALLRSGAERRRALVGKAESEYDGAEDELTTSAEEMSDLANALDNEQTDPAAGAWNCEVTWIVARKAITVRKAEAWMAVRWGGRLEATGR